MRVCVWREVDVCMVIHGRNVYGCEWERERVEMGWGTQGRVANSESMIANLLSLFNEGKDFCLQGFLDFN